MSNSNSQLGNWWNKIVAIIAVANLLLVLFNLSYIPLRDIYLRHFPAVVTLYDPVKSIQPHPDTQRYLNTVEQLKSEIARSGLEANSTSKILVSLRQQSSELIEENPFFIANKFATFAKLQRRMEYRVNTTSAKLAFATFWTKEYLADVGTSSALSFFERKIRPLLEVNYYRNVDENGQFVDLFWRVDIYFVVFFALELLARTFFISKREPSISWLDAILRGWYDGLMLLPTWRWLRVIPVAVRLHKSGLVNMERILAQITHEPAAYLADRVSMFLMVRLINQTQEAVKTGDAARMLLAPPSDYIEIGKSDKFDVIVDRLLELSIYKVLPQVQPDLESLVHYSMTEALTKSDFYQTIQQVPGLETLPAEATEHFADYLATTTYEVIASSYSDLKGRELFDHLSDRFKQALRQELLARETQSELQLLLSDLLEELKINYIQRSSEEDAEATLAEAEQLRQIQ
ncbi:MAG: hypothetical protein AB4038_15650 [Prochloraceae cyanobacterium]